MHDKKSLNTTILLLLLSILTAVNSQKVYTISGNYGQTCNQLLSLSYALKQVSEENATLILWGTWTRLVIDHLDVQLLQRHYSLQFQDAAPPAHIPVIQASEGVFYGLRNAMLTMKWHLRPRAEYRRIAEETLRVQHTIRPIIGVHLRYFTDAQCRGGILIRPQWIQEGTPCHVSVTNYTVDTSYLCRHQFDQHMVDMIQDEWPELSAPYSFYVASDKECPEYIETFFRKTPHIRHSIRGGENLFVDMWMNTLADYYIANPMSSCEPIVTQWRNLFWRHYPVRVMPRACFGAFAT